MGPVYTVARLSRGTVHHCQALGVSSIATERPQYLRLPSCGNFLAGQRDNIVSYTGSSSSGSRRGR